MQSHSILSERTDVERFSICAPRDDLGASSLLNIVQHTVENVWEEFCLRVLGRRLRHGRRHVYIDWVASTSVVYYSR